MLVEVLISKEDLPNGKIKDLRGTKIGDNGYVMAFSHIDEFQRTCWVCLCGECGTEFICPNVNINKHHIIACRKCSHARGCRRNCIDLTGTTFGHNCKVIKLEKRTKEDTFWECLCGKCGKIFIRATSWINHPESSGCCSNCWKIDYIGREFGYGCKVIKEVKSPNKNRRFLCQCHCGVFWEIESSAIVRDNHTNECRKCSDKTGAILRSGENNPWYDKTLTEEERRGKRISARRWRRAVLKRDNHTCLITGETENLDVHHLDGWDWCKEKRFDKSNGLTVSRNLHNLFHSYYGKGKNSKEQFFQFIKDHYPDKLDSIIAQLNISNEIVK